MKTFDEFLPEGFKQHLGYSKKYVKTGEKETFPPTHDLVDAKGKKVKALKYSTKGLAKEVVEPINEISAKLAASVGKKRLKQGQKILTDISYFEPGRFKTAHRIMKKAADKAFDKSKKAFEYSFKKNVKVKEEVQLDEQMTRKHFQQVADVIKAHPDAAKRAELAKHHATIFKASNPRFDHKRFYAAANATVNEEMQTEERNWMVIDHEGKRHEVYAKDEIAAKKHAVSVGGLHPKGIPMTQWSKVKIAPMPSTGLHGKRGQAYDQPYKFESVEEGVSLKDYNKEKKERDRSHAAHKAFTASTRSSDTKGKFTPDPKVWKKMPSLAKLLGVKVKEEYDYPDPGPETNAHKVGDKVRPKIGPHKGQVHTVIHVHADGSYNIKPEVHVSSNKYRQGAARAQHKDLE